MEETEEPIIVSDDIRTLSRPQVRTCLVCKKPFMSEGPANRFCKACRKSKSRLDGGIPSRTVPGYDCALRPSHISSNFEKRS